MVGLCQSTARPISLFAKTCFALLEAWQRGIAYRCVSRSTLEWAALSNDVWDTVLVVGKHEAASSTIDLSHNDEPSVGSRMVVLARAGYQGRCDKFLDIQHIKMV